MAILVVNPGSETTKFEVFESDLSSIVSGKIYTNDGKFLIDLQDETKEITKEEFENPVGLIQSHLTGPVEKIGFRIVHGGEKYFEPTLLSEDVINDLEKLNDLAPLHNPPAIKIIKQFSEVFKDSALIGVFDTAFHHDMPKAAFMYALPYEFYEKYKIRRYGFHGISVKYVIHELQRLDSNLKKTIVCHLGGGSSITAVENGKSIDTSMGFTPLEGVMMAKRAGSVDDGVIPFLNKTIKMSLEEIMRIENNESGLLGVSGKTGSMRELLELKDDERASLAVEMYVYQIQKQIGAYIAALNGIDGLVFSGGVGEGSDEIRKRICEKLGFAGVSIDDSKNDAQIDVAQNLKISKGESKSVWVIPTNEEIQIAREISS